MENTDDITITLILYIVEQTNTIGKFSQIHYYLTYVIIVLGN